MLVTAYDECYRGRGSLLTLDDFVDGMRRLDISMNRATLLQAVLDSVVLTLTQVFHAIDADSSGLIDMEEFIWAMSSHTPPEQESVDSPRSDQATTGLRRCLYILQLHSCCAGGWCIEY